MPSERLKVSQKGPILGRIFCPANVRKVVIAGEAVIRQGSTILPQSCYAYRLQAPRDRNMGMINKVDATVCSFDIFRDKSVLPRERKPGPPVRIDGMTVGIVTME